ncbi:MAG: hypothetical protein JXA98_00365 [Methanosarcinaceae archaeon]|nr:hypothetical protein [Methanosarcinaceae archaeon]
MSETTTIPTTKTVRNRLKSYGKKGETYTTILTRLMDAFEYEQFMERQYKRLDEKEKFIGLDEA